MISNSMTAHNFAHNLKPNLRSGAMFWEHETKWNWETSERQETSRRVIYSYGYHFPIALIDADANICLFTTDSYSCTTARHISEVRGALRGLNYKIIECLTPGASASVNIDNYISQINTAAETLKRGRSIWKLNRAAETIPETYNAALDYAKYMNIKSAELMPLKKAYKAAAALCDPEILRPRLEKAEELRRKFEAAREIRWEQARRRSIEIAKQRAKDAAEKITRWEQGADIWLSWYETEYNVPLRIEARKGYKVIKTGKGVIIPWNECKRVAGLIQAGALDGLTVDCYKLLFSDAETVQIGCHTFRREYLESWAAKVANME